MRSKKFKRTHTSKAPSKEGVIAITASGLGFVTVPGTKDDIRVFKENTKNALHGDTVLITLVRDRRGGTEGVVQKVIKRARTKFVGTVVKDKNSLLVIPDNYRIQTPFRITDKIEPSTKVYFELREWSEPASLPLAHIIKIIGAKGENNTEMEAIVLEKGFNATFKDDEIISAEKIAEKAKQGFNEEIAKRRDFRNITTFTIDPKDAKDFDDAISFQELGTNTFEIGVHIADVSHYITPGELLDKEGRERGVSVYLVDRTIPMLPEALSNDLCSLKPMEDKLTFSAVFEITREGKVEKSWFGKTIIRSAKRFTYEEAQEILESKKGPHAQELEMLNTIAKKLLDERFKKGAISFEQDEVKFELDPSGKPIRVYRKERKDAHKLVEEYMLLANKEVATYITRIHKHKERPLFVYRIHDHPDPEKIIALGIFLKAIGYELKIEKGKVNPKDLNALFKHIEGEAEEGIVKTVAIRSMAKAVYSTANIGHFGLGFDYYTHFTSPIRRYADVLVHRLLHTYLQGNAVREKDFATYENTARHVTECEIRATEAERDSIKLKQVEYMQERIGQTFEGIISGVTEWGLYVEEKDTKSDGMVRLESLTDDYYELDKKNYRIVGQKTKKKYALGDSVKFKIISADPERKMLIYKII